MTRKLVWIALTAIGLLAAAGALWSAFGTHKISLTETEIMTMTSSSTVNFVTRRGADVGA